MEETLNTIEIAGYCNELTAWRILKEVSTALLSDSTARVSPAHIEIKDDGGFALLHQTSVNLEGFEAPEVLKGNRTEASVVWSLAASVFYLVMGRQVMNGKGGAAQQESSRLPYMRSFWPQLSELVQQCLNYHPEQRPTLLEINKLSTRQYHFCAESVKKGPAFQERRPDTVGQEGPSISVSDFWPEPMILEHLTTD